MGLKVPDATSVFLPARQATPALLGVSGVRRHRPSRRGRRRDVAGAGACWSSRRQSVRSGWHRTAGRQHSQHRFEQDQIGAGGCGKRGTVSFLRRDRLDLMESDASPRRACKHRWPAAKAHLGSGRYCGRRVAARSRHGRGLRTANRHASLDQRPYHADGPGSRGGGHAERNARARRGREIVGEATFDSVFTPKGGAAVHVVGESPRMARRPQGITACWRRAHNSRARRANVGARARCPCRGRGRTARYFGQALRRVRQSIEAGRMEAADICLRWARQRERARANGQREDRRQRARVDLRRPTRFRARRGFARDPLESRSLLPQWAAARRPLSDYRQFRETRRRNARWERDLVMAKRSPNRFRACSDARRARLRSRRWHNHRSARQSRVGFDPANPHPGSQC